MVTIGTDWFVKVKCPRPDRTTRSYKEQIEACAGCPYRIWDEPQSVAGFMNSMCGVRVGSISMAAELDIIAEKLMGIKRFTKIESDAASKLMTLEQIRKDVISDGSHINGLTSKETLEYLDSLIEFCKRARVKGLKIWSWS